MGTLKHCDVNFMWKLLCTRHNYFKTRVSDLQCIPLWNCLKIRCLLHWAIQRKTSRMNTSLFPFCLPVWSADSLRDSTTLQSIWVSDVLSLPWAMWKNDDLILPGLKATFQTGTVKEQEYCGHADRAFSSYLVPLFQNGSSCKVFHMKMSLICMKMKIFTETFPYE